ncbi:MAG: hypothetical protein RIT18_874 [Actinomycetota bacterium]
MVAAERLAVSRLINRIGFGPKPGEFAELLSLGFDRAAAQILSRPSNYRPNLADELSLSDLGLRPRPNTPEILKYAEAKRFQLRSASLWWLDEMVYDHLDKLGVEDVGQRDPEEEGLQRAQTGLYQLGCETWSVLESLA